MPDIFIESYEFTQFGITLILKTEVLLLIPAELVISAIILY
jgi:hypothetical protein